MDAPAVAAPLDSDVSAVPGDVWPAPEVFVAFDFVPPGGLDLLVVLVDFADADLPLAFNPRNLRSAVLHS